MGSDITNKDRIEYEAFIKKHPPYDKNDPELQVFDNPDLDDDRLHATTLRMLLDGDI